VNLVSFKTGGEARFSCLYGKKRERISAKEKGESSLRFKGGARGKSSSSKGGKNVKRATRTTRGVGGRRW